MENTVNVQIYVPILAKHQFTFTWLRFFSSKELVSTRNVVYAKSVNPISLILVERKEKEQLIDFGSQGWFSRTSTFYSSGWSSLYVFKFGLLLLKNPLSPPRPHPI